MATLLSLALTVLGTSDVQPVAPEETGDEPKQETSEPAEEQALTWKDLISEGNKIKFYGMLRLDAQYDDSRPNNTQTIGWILSEDPTAPPPIGAGGTNLEDLTIHPRLTRFGVDLDGGQVASLDAKVTGKIEVDFYNNSLQPQSESRAALRMRHAYVKLAWDSIFLLCGQTNDVISPIFPVINNDLVMWGAGNLGDRRPQIRVEYGRGPDNSRFIAQGEIGLTGANDNSDLDSPGTFGAGYRDGETSGLPTVQARLAYRFGRKEKPMEMGVWGHTAKEEPDTSFNGENEFDSNAVGLDALIPIGSRFTIKGELWQGENVDDVRGGIFQGINRTTGEEIEAKGGFGEIGFQLTDHCVLYAGYSTDDPEDDDVGSGGRAANKIWYVASHWNYKPMRFGLEVHDWTTEYVDFDEGTDTRVVAFIQYTF
jgi:hypothetical protein